MVERVLKGENGYTIIDILVSTGAKESGISGVDKWRKRLIIRVKEKPVSGRANTAIIKLFSRLLDIPTNQIKITAGETSTQKTLEVEMESEEVKQRIGPYVDDTTGRR